MTVSLRPTCGRSKPVQLAVNAERRLELSSALVLQRPGFLPEGASVKINEEKYGEGEDVPTLDSVGLNQGQGRSA